MARLLTGLLLLLSVLTAYGQTINSGLGYSIRLDDDWVVLNRDKARQTIASLDQGKRPAIPEQLWNQVKTFIESGQVEMYVRPSQPGQFTDNVNVLLQEVTIPANREQLDELCRTLPGEFSKAFGRSITVYHCELRPVRGITSLYLNFDGALAGTRSLQYQIPGQGRGTYVFTATASENTLKGMMMDFDKIIQSLQQH